MEFGESRVIKEKGGTRLLEICARHNRIMYCVIGNGSTQYYEDYEDALEEFNLRWLREQFGE